MSASLIFSLLAIALYLTGAIWVLLRLAGKARLIYSWFRGLNLAAVLMHALALYQQLGLPLNVNLGLFETFSLANWFMCMFILLASYRRPTFNLAVILFPLTAILLLLTEFSLSKGLAFTGSKGLYFHLVVSLAAYSFFALASVQALLLALQNRQLKARRLFGVLDALPPLQTMEGLLFDLLITGQLLLSLGILSGALFLDTMFTQGMLHKTLLSIAAWLIFGYLLFGHWRFGWRGLTAVRWTLGGSCLLLLAYFGSKLVVQFILA